MAHPENLEEQLKIRNRETEKKILDLLAMI